MTGWLKAGLIGAAVVVGLKVLQQVPCVNCCAIPAEWVAYGCIGALSAYWISPLRTMGAGAGQGALAGLIAAAIGGVIGIGVDLVGSKVMAPFYATTLRNLPPDVLRQMMDLGIDPRLLTGGGQGIVGTMAGSATCCGVGLVVAAALGALGGLVFAAVRPHKETA